MPKDHCPGKVTDETMRWANGAAPRFESKIQEVVGGAKQNMANIKSSEKRNRQNEKLAAADRVYRGAARTAVKKARLAIDRGDEDALALIGTAARALDKAAGKGAIHKGRARATRAA